MAFGAPSKKKSNKKKSGKASASGDQRQFEQWKAKDEEVKPWDVEVLFGFCTVWQFNALAILQFSNFIVL